MQIWILRHADAEESSESGKDEDRALTREGARRAAAVGRGLAALDPGIEAIVTSPYRRARETARCAAQALGLAKIIDSRSLEPGRDPAAVARELELYAPLVTRDSYLVVMDTVVEHLPDDSFEDRPWGKGNNPLTAVREFLQRSDRFVVDKEIEDKLLLTVAPSGYLRCLKD